MILFKRTEGDLNIVVWTDIVFTSCCWAISEASGVLMAGLGGGSKKGKEKNSPLNGIQKLNKFNGSARILRVGHYAISTPMLDLSYCFWDTSRFLLLK